MTRRLRARAGAATISSLLVLGALAAVAGAPPVLAGDPCYHGYSIPTSTTAAGAAVRMEPCAFVPTNIRVPAGTTVTFTNGSGEPHLLTGANQAWGDRDREIAPGGRISVTFDTPGVYAFSCALHRGMSGAVIVGDADSAGTAAGAAGATDAGPGSHASMPGAASASSSADLGDLAGMVGIAALGVLAVVGWASALVQRRRASAAEAARTIAS